MALAGLAGKLEFQASEASAEEIYSKCINELKNDTPVIVEIGYTRNGQAYTHSVVAYGMVGDGTQASDFLAMDPWQYTAESSKTGSLNTLQDSLNMFAKDSPYLKAWSIFVPI